MNSNYIKKLGFTIWKTNIEAQKIDSSILETFEMVIIDFQVEDKINRPRFFQKIFWIANIKFEIMLKIFFWKISNTNMLCDKKILIKKFYAMNKILSITEQVQIIGR